MNKKHFKAIIYAIIIGLIVGSLIGAAGYYGIIPREFRESVTYSTIKICIGLIVLITDLLCVWGLLKPLLDQHIDKNGESVTGVIESASELPHPDEFTLDKWSRRARYSFVVSYNASAEKITKEFPPTPLITERDLYPLLPEEGSKIEIKYLKSHPKLSVIDNGKIKAARKTEQQNDRFNLIYIPLTATVLYIFAIIIL